ncbi:MAG: PAS domain-containing protein, partial [candidate division Zixibacteria bacterium]|nr:PAS domain-containing protein [candidate division Zixibacteria bacterium]
MMIKNGQTGIPQFRLKPLYFIILAIILSLLMILFSNYGLKGSQENMLTMMQKNGAALLESLVYNSSTVIEGGALIEEIVMNDYIRSLDNLKNARLKHLNTISFLKAQVLDADADGGLVLYKDKILTQYPDKTTRLGKFAIDELDTLRLMMNEIIENEIGTFILKGYQNDDLTVVAALRGNDYKLFFFKAGSLSYPELEVISIGNLIDKISREPGIEYLLLQNYDGIVFASRKIEKMLRISEDQFLGKAFDDTVSSSRITEFNGRKVLEVVRPYYSEGDFNGLFRLGLSLDQYNSLAGDYSKRTYILTAIFVILLLSTILVMYLYQRYLIIRGSYKHISNIYNELLSRIPSGVIEINNSNLITAINSTGTKILNLDADGLVGKDYRKVLDSNLFRFEESVRTEEVSFTAADGEQKILTAICTRVQHSDSDKMSNLAVFYDITELRKYQEQAKRNQRLKELGDMAAGIAHEIRNPLNAISIGVQRLKEELPHPDDPE